MSAECRLCDRRALRPSDFVGGYFEPGFASLCAFHLARVLKCWSVPAEREGAYPSRGWLYCNHGKYHYYNVGKQITAEEFVAALTEYIEVHCRRLDKGLPLRQCEGYWGNQECGRWAKEQRDGHWLCARHLSRENVVTKAGHRNKLAERIAAEILRA